MICNSNICRHGVKVDRTNQKGKHVDKRNYNFRQHIDRLLCKVLP